MRTVHVISLVGLMLVGACTAAPRGAQPLASKVVGPEGGHMEAPGIALDIPAGALDGSQTISIYAAAPAADGSTSISKAFRFEPSGLEFAQPISVHLDVPAGANGIVRWSRLGDPTSFEFAGFVSNGVADAQNTHFSTAEATAEDGCDDLVPGEALCAPSSAPEEDCRQLCDCVDSDPMPSGITLPNIHLCDRDPANDNGTCPLDPTLPPAQGPEEQFGERDGNACTGWGWVSTQIYLCDCLASAPVVTVAPSTMNTPELCAMPETQGPTGNWLCDSTPSYPICLGASCPPVGVQTKNPVPSECPTGSPDRRLCDYQWNAYVGTGPTDSEGCLGYYTYDDGQGHVVNKSTTGHVENCAVITILSAEQKLQGKTASCHTFAKDPNYQDNRSADDVERCQLTKVEWEALKQQRMGCGLPLDPEQKMLDPNGSGKRFRVTTAQLRVTKPDGTMLGPIAGVSKNGRDFCKIGSPINEDAWTGIGSSRCYEKKVDKEPTGQMACMSSNESRGHAEGHVLLQLAEQRKRVRAPFPAPPPTCSANEKYVCMPDWASVDNVGERGGCGELIVDRIPCGRSCAVDAIFDGMNAAGLDKLIVHEPTTCVLYEKGGSPTGTPCSASTTCASP